MQVGEYDTLVGGNHSNKKTFFHRFKFAIIAAVVIVIAIATVFAIVFTSVRNKSVSSWDEQISTSSIMSHLQQLQNIADANNGTRASTTSGYNASVEYVVSQLKQYTDYEVTVQDFSYMRTGIVGTPSNISVYADCFQQYDIPYNPPGYIIMGSAGGSVELNNVTVDLVLNFGCNESDYVNVRPGNVALVARGVCTFAHRAAIAALFNASAVIVYSQMNAPDIRALSFILSDASTLFLATNYFHGMSMIGATISVSIATQLNTMWTMNVIADTRVGRPDSVVVIGSHLDSVPAGPGINDNGSGSSLNLALAIEIASSSNQNRIKNKIRFCWFAAEELGLLGSYFYVKNLNATNVTALNEIAVNLNFDMIGSPNFIRGVYNGSSDSHIGSHVVQALFNNYYASQNINVTNTPFTGRSDYGPFLEAGIPAGGLFTGAEGVKTSSERTAFGGFANVDYDPCYHKECDNIENIDQGVVGDMARGAAHVLEQLATAENLNIYLQTMPMK